MFGALIIEVTILVALIGQFILQYFLSTRETKWLGLILPVVCVIVGMIYALNGTTIPAAVTGFLIGGGLPCGIHLVIYKLCRSRWEKKNRDRIEKMNIQDL